VARGGAGHLPRARAPAPHRAQDRHAEFAPRAAAVLLAAALALGGCQAADAVINNSTLNVQTQMSESVFLDPAPSNMKTVYVSVRNTSDRPEVDFRAPLMQAISARGYRVVDDPNQAHFMLRANVLQVGPVKEQDRGALLSAKYGEPLLAGAAVGGLTSAFGGGSNAALGVGLGVAAGAYLANQLVRNVTYAVVTDIQLSERPRRGAVVNQRTTTVAAQGNSSVTAAAGPNSRFSGAAFSSATTNARVRSQDVFERADFKQYQLRSIAYAEKVNLQFEEAVPVLVQRLAGTLSNLFE
jgi:hypothetical protein